MIGIYRIRNNKTNTCYIGSSMNITKRWNDHIKMLINGRHNYKFQRDFKYSSGIEDYSFEILEFFKDTHINQEELFKVEQEYLDKYLPTLNIYLTVNRPNSKGHKKRRLIKKKDWDGIS